MTDNSETPIGENNSWLAGGGLLGGIGAFIGASCCVLPIILFNMGVSSALIAQLAFFANYKDEFLFGSLVLVGFGAVWAFRGGRRPGRRAVIIFALAVFFVATAYVLPFYEQDLLTLFGLRA